MLGIVYGIWTSLLDYNLHRPESIKFVGLANYYELLLSPTFQKVILTTIIFTGASVGLIFLIGVTLALITYRFVRFGRVIRTILFLPYVLPPVVVGLIFRTFMFNPNPSIGYVNYFLSLMGVKGPEWLGTGSMSLLSVILVEVWQMTPFCYLLTLAGLFAIPSEIIDASLIDGAGWVRSAIHIILPILKPTLASMLILRTSFTLASFDRIYIITRGGPGIATTTIPIQAYRSLFLYLDAGQASCMAIILALIALLFTVLYYKFLYQMR